MDRQFGAQGVGIVIGTDMCGQLHSVVPCDEEFAGLADLLPRRGLERPGVDAAAGGNYLRALRQAVAV